MKPLLSATVDDISKLNYPLLASPKLDGIRALVINGHLVSRTLKRIQNAFTNLLFSRKELDGLDGELIVGEPNSKDTFNTTTSAIMSKAGVPRVKYYVFDYFGSPSIPFRDRNEHARLKCLSCSDNKNIVHLTQTLIRCQAELVAYEQDILAQGYEGVMLRSELGIYKYGRSTLREGILMKLKRFIDAEAVITGFEEQLHNANEAVMDNLGHTKRSTHKANKIGKNTLGALTTLVVNGEFEGVKLSIGSGMDDKLRQQIWNNQDHYKGKVVKFKYFPIGSKDAPRIPIFIGFIN